jgi:hypothetical protein
LEEEEGSGLHEAKTGERDRGLSWSQLGSLGTWDLAQGLMKRLEMRVGLGLTETEL